MLIAVVLLAAWVLVLARRLQRTQRVLVEYMLASTALQESQAAYTDALAHAMELRDPPQDDLFTLSMN